MRSDAALPGKTDTPPSASAHRRFRRWCDISRIRPSIIAAGVSNRSTWPCWRNPACLSMWTRYSDLPPLTRLGSPPCPLTRRLHAGLTALPPHAARLLTNSGACANHNSSGHDLSPLTRLGSPPCPVNPAFTRRAHSAPAARGSVFFSSVNPAFTRAAQRTYSYHEGSRDPQFTQPRSGGSALSPARERRVRVRITTPSRASGGRFRALPASPASTSM